MRERSDSEREAITNLKLTSRRPTRGAGRLARNPAAPRAPGAATTGRSGHPELGLDRQRCHDSSSTAIHTKKSAIFPPSFPHLSSVPPPLRTHTHAHPLTIADDAPATPPRRPFHECSACRARARAPSSDVGSPLALGEATNISPTETRDTIFLGRYFVMLTVHGSRSHPPALGRPCRPSLAPRRPLQGNELPGRRCTYRAPSVSVRPATTWPAGPVRPDPVAGSPTQTQVRVGRFGEIGRG